MSVLVQATNRREACTPFQSSLLLAEKYCSNEKRKFFVTVILCLLFTPIAIFAFFYNSNSLFVFCSVKREECQIYPNIIFTRV